ncbi:MAG: hypothetical protein JWP87_4221, partial [Labilithrix sp.]|nr:hypothetical protein [Labilithrix sp.]
RGSPAPPAAGAPQPAPRPAAGRPPDVVRKPDSKPDIPIDVDLSAGTDDDEDGVTTQAPAPHMGSSPDLATKSIVPDTLASATATHPGATLAARSTTSDDGADEPATRPGVEGVDEPPTRPGVEGVEEPPTRPGLEEPETSKRIDAAGYANDADDDDDDESITTRGRPVVEPYDGDSVTTQAPAVPSEVVEAALEGASRIADASDDGTEGTTKKARKPLLSSPADSESGSITSQAPGPLTNILRVIASGSAPELDEPIPNLDDEELPENRTAVMPNAPLKGVLADVAGSALPPIRPTGGPLTHGPRGAAALRLEPTSESGLRVARASTPSGERASLGPLADGRTSGVGRSANALASDGSISAPMDARAAHAPGEMAMFPPKEQPSLHDVDLGKGPRYGLLVGIVALISICVPVTLFVALRHNAETPAVPGVPSEPQSGIEKRDASARQKAVRGKNGLMVAASASVAPSASASAAPSASPSSKPGTGLRGGPLPGRR